MQNLEPDSARRALAHSFPAGCQWDQYRIPTGIQKVHIVQHLFRRFLCSAFIMAPACLMLTGCGGSTGPVVGHMAVVTGKVIFKGSPLVKGAIMFTPLSGTVGTGALGVTNENGEYKLIHRNQKDGIEPGSYKVVITRMVAKDGGPIPEGKTAADVEAVQVIPAPFSDPNSDFSGTVVTVPESGGAFNFEIPG